MRAEKLIGEDFPRLQAGLSLWYRSMPRSAMMLAGCLAVALLVNVWLAHVPAQGAPTRQRAFLDELSPEENNLVKELADPEQRIVVSGQSEGRAIAEVAHEKLFTAWGRLQTWLTGRRGFYAWATQIETWRKEWEQAGRKRNDLFRRKMLPCHSLISPNGLKMAGFA
jgi:hypothetical protein